MFLASLLTRTNPEPLILQELPADTAVSRQVVASEQGAWLSTLADVLLWMLLAQAEVCYPKYIPAGEELSPLAKKCVCV